MNRYHRDMTGYGATPPDPQWPGGAKIAVQIVLNYEEGGREQHLARRCRLRGVSVRNHRCRPLAGAAALEHGIDI